MTDEKEPLTFRVLRMMKRTGRPLKAGAIVEAFADERSTIVYSTISNLSKDNKPIRKDRDSGGAYVYSIAEGVDVDEWIEKRKPRVRLITTEKPPEADDVQIVRILTASPKRLQGDDIYELGDFRDKRSVFLALVELCEPDGLVERDRPSESQPFYYQIKRGIDVDGWLQERGAAVERAQPMEIPVFGKSSPAPPTASETRPVPPAEEPTMRVEPIQPKPRAVAETVAELLHGAQGDLLECAEAHSDPQIKALGRRVRLLLELRDVVA